MPDLEVDFDLLSESSRSLGDIYQAFDGLKSRSAQTESDWGAGAIASAMGSFSGDWDSHRDKIMKSAQTLKQMTDQAVEAFKDTDKQLAGGLQQTKVVTTTHGGAQ